MSTQEIQFPFVLESGEKLNLKLAYAVFGKLESNNPVVWVCHALTGSPNVFDWWSGSFGENKLFNAQNFTILCVNIPGSAYGSTSPLDKNDQDTIWFDEFPIFTTRDVANAFEFLRIELKINTINWLIGASIGGQIALEWALIQQEKIKNLVLIASNAYHSPFGIAFNESQRLAIKADPSFQQNRIDGGKNGLMAAKSIALLSYRTSNAYNLTQKEKNSEKIKDFRASSYQAYQGWKLSERFNAYSYFRLTQTMDSHNIARHRTEVEELNSACSQVLNSLKINAFIIGITSDLLFPLQEQEFLAKHILNAQLFTIESDYGHDAFLVEFEQLNKIFNQILNK